MVAVQPPDAVAETNVVLAGSGRLTDGEAASLGPLFITSITYSNCWSGTTPSNRSVLVIARSIVRTMGLVWVDVLSDGFASTVPSGGVTVAVFATEPDASERTVAVTT